MKFSNAPFSSVSDFNRLVKQVVKELITVLLVVAAFLF